MCFSCLELLSLFYFHCFTIIQSYSHWARDGPHPVKVSKQSDTHLTTEFIPNNYSFEDFMVFFITLVSTFVYSKLVQQLFALLQEFKIILS